MPSKRNRLSDKFIKFSIGAKLVTIITILILISLGATTAVITYDVGSKYEHNILINLGETHRLVSREVESIFTNIRSNSQMVINIINEAGADSRLAENTLSFFFNQNEQIAAITFLAEDNRPRIIPNKDFFSKLERRANISFVESYYEKNKNYFLANESFLLNASEDLKEDMLAMFFYMDGVGTVSVLYAPENINKNFASSLNPSLLINNEDRVIISAADWDLGKNYYHKKYVRDFRTLGSTEPLYYDEDDDIKYFIRCSKLSFGDSVIITRMEFGKIAELINDIMLFNIYTASIVVFLAIMFIWFFSKTISSALKILSNAARQIEGGSFELNLKPKSRDEIGFLTTSFQRMSKALSIFGRFVNREIAIKAMRGEIKPGGLPKHATVFFSDIRGFTEKSENFTKEFGGEAPDKIVFWLNNYLTQMVDCVEKTNGVVDKFIGDAVMAHWGTAYTAGSPAKDAFNGVKAALMMRKALIELNKMRRPGDPADPPICIGCGLNTGIVTAGQIGSDLRMEYTVIGDPVNLASRIEALNKPLGTDILISESTWNLVKYFFICEEMPSVTVKGKEKPVRIFAVVNHVSVTSGPKTLAEVRELLGIEAPDVSKADLDSDEKKYKIGTDN
ncbi:MAG: adenylate/guanylate cyclase domain-containing protein [Treponema sp.]|nr:adenylate/guanylate cyclase domain-containing protein [Treponema sp.]